MAPTPSKLSSNAEGKKSISVGVQKKKGKEPPSLSYLLLRAMRQNVGMENEQIVGWGLVQGTKKTILVIWYLAKISPTGVVLTAPSGHGQPEVFASATIQRNEIDRGDYAVVDPIPIWATTRMVKPTPQVV
jgi:hypothetical protein